MDILASTSAAVQRQVSADDRYPVLPAAAVYSALLWTKNLSAKRIRDVTRVMQIRPIEGLVDSKIETENQRSLSRHTTRNFRDVLPSQFLGLVLKN